MAAPVPVPTTDQLVIVAEIMMINANDVLALVSADVQAISTSKWARTLTDIESWDDIRNEAGDIKKVGSIEFFENKQVGTRLDFRNILRLRYGLPVLVDELGDGALESVASLAYF